MLMRQVQHHQVEIQSLESGFQLNSILHALQTETHRSDAKLAVRPSLRMRKQKKTQTRWQSIHSKYSMCWTTHPSRNSSEHYCLQRLVWYSTAAVVTGKFNNMLSKPMLLTTWAAFQAHSQFSNCVHFCAILLSSYVDPCPKMVEKKCASIFELIHT